MIRSNKKKFKKRKKKKEIKAAAAFISEFIMHSNVGEDHVTFQNSICSFQNCLTSLLTDKFEGHWYPANAQRGQGYRSIRLDKSQPTLDPILAEALQQSGLNFPRANWPEEMIFWVDPDAVTFDIVPRDTHPRHRISQQIYPVPPLVHKTNAVHVKKDYYGGLPTHKMRRGWRAAPCVVPKFRPYLNLPPPPLGLVVHTTTKSNNWALSYNKNYVCA